ncbi:MAG: hypothetical protein CUN54_10760 [Phototrophicales bacterium]|nr:MAG: hypothetical protein CUN54_10760 [Phototrophicales bacterium]
MRPMMSKMVMSINQRVMCIPLEIKMLSLVVESVFSVYICWSSHAARPVWQLGLILASRSTGGYDMIGAKICMILNMQECNHGERCCPYR